MHASCVAPEIASPAVRFDAPLGAQSPHPPWTSRITSQLSSHSLAATTKYLPDDLSAANQEHSSKTATSVESSQHIRMTDYEEGVNQLASAYQSVIRKYSDLERSSLQYRCSAGTIKPEVLSLKTPNNFMIPDRLPSPPQMKASYSTLSTTSTMSTQPTIFDLPLYKPSTSSSISPSGAPTYKLSAELVGPQKFLLNQFTGRSVAEVLAFYEALNRLPNGPRLSQKVFLGGVPMINNVLVTEATCDQLTRGLSLFGPVTLLWPKGTVIQSNLAPNTIGRPRTEVRRGHCYATFRDPISVALLLSACQRRNKGCYINLSALCPEMRSSHVLDAIQVIPWDRSDAERQYADAIAAVKTLNMPACCSTDLGEQLARPPPLRKRQYSVFVGALHGMLTARALYAICNDLFGNVDGVVLDTDRYHYPIGSGRVTFTSPESYLRAVNTNFVHVECQFFKKTIQIDPYLEDALCCKCGFVPGVYFCRDLKCFDYFCPACWVSSHPNYCNHKPLRRTLNQRSYQ